MWFVFILLWVYSSLAGLFFCIWSTIMAPSYLDKIDCSDQPLDISFHPQRENLLAVGLVDGTVEGRCETRIHDNNGVSHTNEEKQESCVSDLQRYNMRQMYLNRCCFLVVSMCVVPRIIVYI